MEDIIEQEPDTRSDCTVSAVNPTSVATSAQHQEYLGLLSYKRNEEAELEDDALSSHCHSFDLSPLPLETLSGDVDSLMTEVKVIHHHGMLGEHPTIVPQGVSFVEEVALNLKTLEESHRQLELPLTDVQQSWIGDGQPPQLGRADSEELTSQKELYQTAGGELPNAEHCHEGLPQAQLLHQNDSEELLQTTVHQSDYDEQLPMTDTPLDGGMLPALPRHFQMEENKQFVSQSQFPPFVQADVDSGYHMSLDSAGFSSCSSSGGYILQQQQL